MEPNASTSLAPVLPAPAYPPVVPVYRISGTDSGIAVILELLPGLFAQTFGIGNIYAGNVAGGICLMIGYWVATFVNILLCFAFIGFITLPFTWVAFMVIGPILANNAAKRKQMLAATLYHQQYFQGAAR